MMDMLEKYKRKPDEDYFSYKLRLCRAKLVNGEDIGWKTITTLLGEKVTVDHFRKTAKGIIEYDNFIKNKNKPATKILSISDLHIPFHKPLSALSEHAGTIDVLQINGDILDCQQLSKFSKSYRISPVEEIIIARQYLIDLIDMIRPSKVLVNYGNHDLRLGQYVSRTLDNELQELIPETALDYIFLDGFTHYDRKTRSSNRYDPLIKIFPDIDIEYTQTWYSKYQDIIFAHPKAFASSPLKTAEKALYWFRNEGFQFHTLVMAHTHRVGSYHIGNSAIYEQGAFCNTDKMLYNDGQLINSQKQGYMVIGLDANGKVMDDQTKIVVMN